MAVAIEGAPFMGLFKANRADQSADEVAASRLMAIASRSRRAPEPIENVPEVPQISAEQAWINRLGGNTQDHDPAPAV